MGSGYYSRCPRFRHVLKIGHIGGRGEGRLAPSGLVMGLVVIVLWLLLLVG
jgi:hypothetical protein